MADNDKKPFAHLLPAILTGLAALIAALTGVYVNLRGDAPARPERVLAAPVATPGAVAPADAAPVPARPASHRLRVERIGVRHDGSPGTTDWRFEVAADGEPLFVFQQDGLDDTGGRNVALPDGVGASLERVPSTTVRITIKAWRGSRLRMAASGPDATGSGVLRAGGTLVPIEVVAPRPADGAFVLHLSARPD